jgi:hypothetical protein
MSFRWRLWTKLKLALRKRAVPASRLPFELDEFAALLSSDEPSALRQLAAGLARQADSRSHRARA